MTKPTIHKGEIDAAPEEVGFLPAKLDRLDAFFLDLIPDTLQAAGYLLARGGKVFAHRTMGRLKRDDEAAGDLMPGSIRQIASITKAFTAIAIMQLVEDGRIYLAQPVATVIDEFDTNMHRDIRIDHLLTHTSGLAADGGYFFEPYPVSWWPLVKAGEIKWLEAALSGPALCKPGEEWNYCSIGYAVLGEIVTRVSEVHVEEYLLQEIAAPLGMADTFFDIVMNYVLD